MRQVSGPSAKRRARVGAATGIALLGSVLSVTAQAAPNPAGATGWQQRPQHADYDSRDALGSGGGLPAAFGRSADSGPPPVVVQKLRDRLGVQGIVDIDNATGTPRRVARTDGFLTAASRQKPADIALGYVGAHTDVFGLDAKAVAGLTLRRDYVDIEGTHHLSFVQAVGGVPVFGNGLKAHVARGGRLIQVDGAPVKHLPAAMGSAKLTATAARAIAVKDVAGTSATVTKAAFGPQRTTGFSDGGSVKQVWFQTADGPRLAWQTFLLDDGFVHVIDATSGRILYRHNTVEADTGRAFANYPGAAVGGKQRRVDLSDWLPDGSPRLVGHNAHVSLPGSPRSPRVGAGEPALATCTHSRGPACPGSQSPPSPPRPP